MTERGQVEAATWGEVAVGNIVRDQKSRLWTVADERDGWLRLVGARTGESSSVKRPVSSTPVWIYIPSEDEALLLLHAELGAVFLRDIEAREHTIQRVPTFRMDPMSANATVLRDHLDMAHQLPVDDVLRRYNKAVDDKKGLKDKEAKKAAGERAQAAIQELFTAHDEAHADPHLWPMAIPHYHQREN